MRRLGDEDKYSAKGRRKLRRALLSVYYHTVGREFEVRGAPSVLLPPEIDPMSLREALAVIAVSRPPRLNEALWRVVRSVPLASDPDDISQYPSALAAYLTQNDLKELNRYRSAFRQNSEQFSITLLAIREKNYGFAAALPNGGEFPKQKAIPFGGADHVDFTTALDLIVGYSDNDYFKHLLDPLMPAAASAPGFAAKQGVAIKTPLQKLSRQIAAIGSDVGLSIKTLVETLADIAAFETVVPVCVRRQVGATKKAGVGRPIAKSEVFVYPVNTIIKQQTRSMAVSATVTTIVRGPFGTLTNAMNPAHWACSSDVIQKSDYVEDIISLQASGQSRDTPSEGKEVRALLDEKVRISWDESDTQQAQYHNVMNIGFSVRESKGEADANYNLCRSIKSSILWDRGPGGLLLDQGYIKLRKLGDNIWRVTMHKELLFGDVDGSGALTGPRDLGQLISYLAPVALTYWLESEIYSLADPHPNETAGRRSGPHPRRRRRSRSSVNPGHDRKHQAAWRRDGNG